MWGAVETGVSGCSATGPLLAEGAAGVVAASGATEDTGGAEWCCMGGCSTPEDLKTSDSDVLQKTSESDVF